MRGYAARNAPLDARFWSRVQKGEGCWLWVGQFDHSGYGRWNPKRNIQKRAHRVAWEFTRGSIPPGLMVCHHCDNPPCCNPDHLFLGTNADNVRDAVRKGRFRRTLLTTPLSEWLLTRGISMREFAKQVGTHGPVISMLCSGAGIPSAALCLRIIDATGGAVTLRDLVTRGIEPAETEKVSA